jgi:hypothetical protein
MPKINKEELFQRCATLLSFKISDTQRMIDEIRVATSEDTKSSAGDKHETSRAMSQLELDKLSTVLSNLNQQNQFLQSINPKKEIHGIEAGAIVHTNGGIFFLATALGRLDIDGTEVWAIGTHAPLVKTLVNALENGSGEFNGKVYRISHIE